jgi:Ca2+-transporting ATPase
VAIVLAAVPLSVAVVVAYVFWAATKKLAAYGEAQTEQTALEAIAATRTIYVNQKSPVRRATYFHNALDAALTAHIAVILSPVAPQGAEMTHKQLGGQALSHESFIAYMHAVSQGRRTLVNIRKAVSILLIGNAAALAITLLSLGGMVLSNIPPAISLIHILAIIIIVALPALTIARDKLEADPMKERPRAFTTRVLQRAAGRDVIGCGLLIGGLAFANYLWFFERIDVHASYLATSSAIHVQATALSFLTAALCVLIYAVHKRCSAGVLSRYQLQNGRFWLAILLSLAVILGIVYIPWFTQQPTIGTLSLTDWLYALGAAGIFTIICEFLRHNRKHHRKAVLELHRRVNAPRTSTIRQNP